MRSTEEQEQEEEKRGSRKNDGCQARILLMDFLFLNLSNCLSIYLSNQKSLFEKLIPSSKPNHVYGLRVCASIKHSTTQLFTYTSYVY